MKQKLTNNQIMEADTDEGLCAVVVLAYYSTTASLNLIYTYPIWTGMKFYTEQKHIKAAGC